MSENTFPNCFHSEISMIVSALKKEGAQQPHLRASSIAEVRFAGGGAKELQKCSRWIQWERVSGVHAANKGLECSRERLCQYLHKIFSAFSCAAAHRENQTAFGQRWRGSWNACPALVLTHYPKLQDLNISRCAFPGIVIIRLRKGVNKKLLTQRLLFRANLIALEIQITKGWFAELD